MEQTSKNKDSKESVIKKRTDKREASSPSNGAAPSISGTNEKSAESSRKKRASILSDKNTGRPSTSARATRDDSPNSDIENKPSTSSQQKKGKRAPSGSANKKDNTLVKRHKTEVDNGNAVASPKVSNKNPTSHPSRAMKTIGNSKSEGPTKDAIRRMIAPVFNMMLPKKVLAGVMVDEQVIARKNETPEQLLKQVEREVREAKGEGEWKYDYIVSSTCRKKYKIVIKGVGYPLPNYINMGKKFVPRVGLEPYYTYWKRDETMDLLEAVLINEFGGDKKGKQKFLEKYPHRFAPDEDGATESAFITNPITKCQSILRAIEWRICQEAKNVNQPDVLFADWTGTTDDTLLPNFKFTNMLMPSKKVRKAMDKSNEFGAITCKKRECSESDQPCDSAVLNPTQQKDLSCACKIVKASKDRRLVIDKSPVECIDACKCDKETCGNRVIQYGRQHRVQVWKDWRKGWTLRSLSKKIKKGDFLGEYTGEVMTNYESLQRDDNMYFMEMPNCREIEDPEEKGGQRMHQKLVIDAAKHGNETRFISHSCDPNLRLVNAYVERHGGWFSRMVFIAKRDIEFGEEFTFDYFPNVKMKMCEKNVNEIFDECFCETDKCKFKCKTDFAKLRADREKEKAEQKRIADEEGDSWDDESDNETAEQKAERLKKQRISRGKRNEMRNNMKVRAEEEEALARALEESAEESERGQEEEDEEDAAVRAEIRRMEETSSDEDSEENDEDEIIVVE